MAQFSYNPRVCCVDGTNLVRSGYGYGGPQFREQEEADAQRLVEALAQVCEAVGSRVEIEVVFDGARRGGPWPAAANLRVRFAQELEADELILDLVRARSYAGGGAVLVVTADAELGRQADDEGGRWLRVTPGTRLENVIRAIEKKFGGS